MSSAGGIFRNRYGAFDPATMAFRIEDPKTPRPWANVMSNDRYGLVLSQSGAGFSWLDNCQLFRLTRWEQDLVQNYHGRWLYVQDLDQPSTVWSTTYQPTRIDAERETVEHGLGWSTFSRTLHGIETTQTVFVPFDRDCEIWIVRVANVCASPKRVRLSAYLEWHLGDVGEWHREFHRLFMESRVEGDLLVAWKHAGLPDHQRGELEEPIRAVMGWKGLENSEPRLWMTDKTAFLGPEGSAAHPLALESAQLPPRSKTPRWDDPVGVAATEMNLEAGSSRTLVLVIGAARGEAKALALADGVDVAWAERALEEMKIAWRDRCAALGSNTGDEAIDRMTGTWLPYQAIAGRLYARCAYYQQGGAYGYRDQLQDSLALLHAEPGTTLTQLQRHAEAMFEDGGVRHWWHPGGYGPASWHSDTSLWLAFGMLEYLGQTGDTSVLSLPAGFLQREDRVPAWAASAKVASDGDGSMLDHCIRGIERFLSLRSARGLPLIGAGDWNDGLSHAGLDGKGESVWLAMFGYDILNRWTPWLSQVGCSDLAKRFADEALSLQQAVEEHAWDGEWYLGGTRDDGEPFGSKTCQEGRIFLNPQTWAVLTGIASEERAAQALESVRKHLVTPYGALLLQPAYSKVDPYIGYITRYAPGLRENGGVYSHASTWAVAAFAKAGDLEMARSIYRGMLPNLRAEQDADAYAAEPYVMPGNVDGPDSPYPGKAGWTWYTGSAAWMVRVARLLETR